MVTLKYDVLKIKKKHDIIPKCHDEGKDSNSKMKNMMIPSKCWTKAGSKLNRMNHWFLYKLLNKNSSVQSGCMWTSKWLNIPVTMVFLDEDHTVSLLDCILISILCWSQQNYRVNVQLTDSQKSTHKCTVYGTPHFAELQEYLSFGKVTVISVETVRP